ncbi:MAG TPA: Flp family type IVb pilin [Candidatus Limnocylindria bacterium]|nr:Flp family type IVb pilin [Candidatus Limnocylindria bacterium]
MLAFFRDDDGQGLVEYALIIAVIAIAVIVAMIFFRGQLQNIFSDIGNAIQKSPCQGPQQTGPCP